MCAGQARPDGSFEGRKQTSGANGREMRTGGGKEGAMSLEQHLEYLLRAALRAERSGDLRVARALRRMAKDTLPIDRSLTVSAAEASTP